MAFLMLLSPHPVLPAVKSKHLPSIWGDILCPYTCCHSASFSSPAPPPMQGCSRMGSGVPPAEWSFFEVVFLHISSPAQLSPASPRGALALALSMTRGVGTGSYSSLFSKFSFYFNACKHWALLFGHCCAARRPTLGPKCCTERCRLPQRFPFPFPFC